jgi:hypothetical protein
MTALTLLNGEAPNPMKVELSDKDIREIITEYIRQMTGLIVDVEYVKIEAMSKRSTAKLGWEDVILRATYERG